MLNPDDHGPQLTPQQAAALHRRTEMVAWYVLPGPAGGVIARAHTAAHNGGQLLPGHLAAASLADLQAIMPPGLTFNAGPYAGSPDGCLGWWWN